jgi:hypothetical protein
MLGEMIGETRGKITGNRVLPSDGQAPKIESSFQESGKMFGMEVTDMGTYWSVTRAGGMLYGEGQGITMIKDGEMASWTGQGVGKFTGRGGAVSFRGALYYQTSSSKLARLNSVAVVFEFEVDETGNTHGKFWEWK